MLIRIGSLFVALLAATVPALAQPVISEFLAQNESVLADEDGDYSDWIEIHNPTEVELDLAGWHLTDRADEPTMWEFPPTLLPPGGHLVVFASNKDRRVPGGPLHTNFALATGGEYLGLIAPDGVTVETEFAPAFPPQIANVSYGTSTPSEWVRLLGKGDPVRVLVPNETNGPVLGSLWRQLGFNDSSWLGGTLAVGFKAGTNDPLGMRGIFETDMEAQMHNLPSRQSVYLRVPFEIEAPADVIGLELRTQSDDGYAAFLNGGGTPVDQRNAPSDLAWNSTATAITGDGEGLPLRITNLSNERERLVAGTNVLAIHGLNSNQGSSDLLIAPQLWALIPNAGEPGRTGYFTKPSPGDANPGNDGLMLVETVGLSEPSRTFAGNLSISLSGAGENQVIRFSTDGSVPTGSSAPYTGPLNLNATTLLRARVFDSQGLGGRTASAHYLRLSANIANRQSNLPMVVLDARGQGLSSVDRRDGFFHLFDRDTNGISALSRVPDAATRHGIRTRGSSSGGQPKRPYSVEFWDEVDEDRNIEILGMTAEADWVFYAPYFFDRTFTRNSVAYEMSRRMGRWAPNTRFVEVYYNEDGGDLSESDYAGVYAIVEQVKMNTRRLGHRLVEPTDIPPPGPINPLAPGPWSGGYLFKIDRTDPDEYNWKTNRNIPSEWLTLNRPKLPDLDGGPYFSNSAALSGSRQVAFLRTYVQSFEDRLATDLAGSFATRGYLDYIDRDSWVDHLIINVLTKNVDALRLSAFFHKPENEKLFAGPVWDFDRSMESYDGRDDDTNTWFGSGDATRYFDFIWWGWLCADPDFAQAFYDRWAELRQGVLSDAGIEDIIVPFGEEIDNSAGGLGSAADRDAARWSQNTPRAGGYPAETQHLNNWVTVRAGWMDRRSINGGLRPAPPAILTSNETATLSGGGTLYYTLDGTDPRASGGSPAGQTYSGPISVTGPVILTARSMSGGVWSTPTTATFNILPPGPLFLPNGTAEWTLNSNWDSSPAPYPDGPGAAATINPPLGGNRNVDLTAPVTIGRIDFPQNDSADRNRIRGELPGNPLTFDNTGSSARLDVGGTGTGFVEFEIVGGTILQGTLEIDVSNLAGDPEFGALRLRQDWSGPGGVTKTGPGVASLTGENKVFTGPTRIEHGVLRVTQPSTMTNSQSVTVLEGGQLRLVSSSTPAAPRDHSFGGDLFLSGSGRGNDIPDASGSGRLGALRYDPGNEDNHTLVTNDVEFVAAASIHIENSRNRLDLTGALRGDGALNKSGGGTLGIIGDHPAYTAPANIANGRLLLRGMVGSAISLAESGTLDAAGSSGPLTGSGDLHLPATTLSTPQVAALRHSMVFTRTGPPDLTDPAASGNALLITGSLATPLALDLYLDLPAPISSETVVQGGFLLPSDASWSGIVDHPAARVFVSDPAGSHAFNGQTWTLNSTAILRSVPTALPSPGGTLDGGILEIRFDDALLDYPSWRIATFSPEDAADDSISGPQAAPFGDGIANLLRFALGIDGSSGLENLPSLSIQDGTATFSFPFDPTLRELRWTVEATSDLSDWNEAEILFDSSVDPDSPDSNGWLHVQSPTSPTMRFYRLRVVEDPVP